MTPEEIDRIRKRAAKATDFIAHARLDIPALLEALEASQDRVRRLEEALWEISDASVPDQPAASAGDGETWVRKHVAGIRRRARDVLQEDEA